jgi:hypothetical protein
MGEKKIPAIEAERPSGTKLERPQLGPNGEGE